MRLSTRPQFISNRNPIGPRITAGLAFFALALAGPATSFAQVFKWTDAPTTFMQYLGLPVISREGMS